jgi:hypothetical protein
MTAQQVYDELAASLAPRGVKASQMFGMPTLKNVNGKAFAGLRGDAVTFRLGAGTPEHTDALKLAGAKPFDPGMGRPMKDWVEVPAKHAKHFERFAIAALDLLG